MFSPPSKTVPSACAPGTSSCRRLRQRMKVDLPQPEGPMMAETVCGAKSMWMSVTARVVPNQAFRPLTSRTGLPCWPASFISSSPHLGATEDPTRPKVDRDHHHHENQRARPSLRVPLVIGADGVGVDLYGERGD